MAGHVFIVRGDLRRLVCDAWLMPCDAHGRPQKKWLLPDWPAPKPGPLPARWADGSERVLALPHWPEELPRPWLVNMDGDEGTLTEWFVEGARQFLAHIPAWLEQHPPVQERYRPLVALPLVGTGREEPDRSGELVAALLDVLYFTASEQDFDIALVTHDGAAFAAAQAARLQRDQDPWPELSEPLRHQARALADRASRGELALFLGAGVSAPAGLPVWSELLDRLAAAAHLEEDEREHLRRLNPLDQAALIEKRLDGPQGLQEALRHIFTRHLYALPHALFAALPVNEVVTTNYDQLFEAAWMALGRRPSVLPYVIHRDADCWILKMHGCVSHPEDIVLTRQDQIGYGERHAALAGIVQALLITRHMLFAGFSLSDDNFHRIAEAVRRVVRSSVHSDEETKPFGTALVLERNRLVEELWEPDLIWTAMSDPVEGKGADPGEAARQLEIFLDYLAAQVRDAAHLLDPRYVAVLTPDEAALRAALLDLARRLSPGIQDSPAGGMVAQVLTRLGLPRPHSR